MFITHNPNIQMVETSPGHIELSCKHSGLKVDSTNGTKNFCDADVCQCKIDHDAHEVTMKSFIEEFMKMEGLTN